MTFGSIPPSPIDWPSLMMPALASQLHAGKAGRGFNCRTGRFITLRLTIKFLTTFTAIVRMARRIAVRAAPARAAVSAEVVAEEEPVSVDQFRGAPGLVSPAVRVAGLLPIRLTTTSSGQALRVPAALAASSKSST